MRARHPQVAQLAGAARRGFTFIELLMAVAITASLIGVTFTFYWFAYRSTFRGMDDINLHKTIRVKMELIERDLRNAMEIEEISPSRLALKVFRDPSWEASHINLSGDDRSMRIVYQLKKGASGGRDEIVRIVDRDEGRFALHDEIAPEIFTARTYDLSGRFIPFDPVVNDSFQRERISLVRIRLKLRDRGTSLELAGEVCPRYLHGKKSDPDWNFNSEALK